MLIFQSATQKNYFKKFAKNNLKNNYLFLKTNIFYFYLYFVLNSKFDNFAFLKCKHYSFLKNNLLKTNK